MSDVTVVKVEWNENDWLQGCVSPPPMSIAQMFKHIMSQNETILKKLEGITLPSSRQP